ncbi:hypothetical protein ACHAW5_003867 [Stephanodiscus triporus]|uniref:Uncharacterized protein n=1 Tax=Stephanodiscus triporus TaxID=2934178 RepID=A0ABD3MRF0_9STRA
MAGNGGGIGRFASRKKNISQPGVPPATVARADGPKAGGRPDDDAATRADVEGGEPAPANDDAVVDDGASAAAMEAERNAADFISFGYDDDGGGGSLAARFDSNDFSSIGHMFGNNDDSMDANDGNVGDVFLSSTPADYASFGQGYDGEYQVFEGFERGSPVGEKRAESPDDYIIREIGADSHPAVHAQNLLTLATTAAAPTGIGGGGTAEGGGIGLFSKKRIIATAATAAAQLSNGHREHQHSNVAGAGVNSVEDMSVSNLSRFDVDLMSKNTDNAIPAMTATNPVGARENFLAGNEECDGVEVPSTIRMSDDDDGDLDDDLTEATASNFAAKEGEGERSKTIIDFSEPPHDQVEAQEAQQGLANDVFHQNVPVQASNCNAGSPREDIVIPRITDATIDQPSSKFSIANSGASKEPSMTRGSMEMSKPSKKRCNGGVLITNQGLAPRVSLSPHPGMNDENRASSRPSLNAENQACLFSPIANAYDDADDDNGIVIPGAPAAVADANANTSTALQTELGGGHIGTISNPPRNPPASTMSKFSTSLLSRQRSSLISSKNGIGKFSTSSDKVQFAAPETRPSATGATKTVDSRNSLVGASLANSNAISKFAAAASDSTAITPDHRQSGVKKSTNDSGGDVITPAFHETPTTAQAPAGTMQYDSTHNDRFVPEIPTVTVGPKAMEEESQVEDPIEARRPRSNAICSPPPPTNKESVTPKASNVNPSFPTVNTNDVLGQSYLKTNTAFYTDETFDELLSQFVNDIQDGTDIFERGQNDLLELEVDLSHAFAAVLRYKDDYTNLLGEIEGVMAMAERIMSEVTSE